MYTLAIRRDFIARHYLIGGDWGPENFPNSHHYVLELQLEGSELDEHGYLVDIVDVEKVIGELVSHFAERMLNDLPEFKDLNPSLEHFARILAMAMNRADHGEQPRPDQGRTVGERLGLGILFLGSLVRPLARRSRR